MTMRARCATVLFAPSPQAAGALLIELADERHREHAFPRSGIEV